MRRVTAALAAAMLAAAVQPGIRAQSPLRGELYASGFTLPVAIVQHPSDPAVQLVLEQGGRIRVVRAGALLASDFLNLTSAVASGGERGLLGLAFAPDYAANGRVFVNFTNSAGHTVVARFSRSSDPLRADPASRLDLRWGGPGAPRLIVQPFSNHNGGHLAFGPDGYLYVGLGDGGSGNDPDHRAQNPSELLGKMLRLDVSVPDDDAGGYRVPPDNPFVAGGPAGTRPEIWSFGLRNPWRYTFDDSPRGGSGALIIADVGQNRVEEVNYEPPRRGGRNYGWRNREGTLENVVGVPPAYLPLTDPIHQYDRTQGTSITGGYVYRGLRLGAAFRGRYFLADFSRGRVWSLGLAIDTSGEGRATDLMEHTADLGGPARLGTISSFGVDAQDELFVLNYSAGTVVRMVGAPPTPPTPASLRILR